MLAVLDPAKTIAPARHNGDSGHCWSCYTGRYDLPSAHQATLSICSTSLFHPVESRRRLSEPARLHLDPHNRWDSVSSGH